MAKEKKLPWFAGMKFDGSKGELYYAFASEEQRTTFIELAIEDGEYKNLKVRIAYNKSAHTSSEIDKLDWKASKS